MKNQLSKISFLFILSLLVFTVSCSSEDEENSEPDGEYLSAKVDNETYNSDLSLNYTNMAGFVTLTGVSKDQEGVLIQFSDQGTGTYKIGGDGANAMTIASFSTYETTTARVWLAPLDFSINDGEIVVTNFTESNIKGSFSFVGSNDNEGTSVQVTEGKFNINF